MAFSQYRFTRASLADNTGALTGVLNPSATPVIFNGPALFTYASADDNIATVSGANYFAPAVFDLAIGDIIIAEGSDASDMLQVDTVDRDAGTVTVVTFTESFSVGTANIQDLAVTTAKIADLAVTTGKLDDEAVTSAKIADNAVTSDQLALNLLQYVAVDVSATQFKAAYGTPLSVLASPGTDKITLVEHAALVMTFNSAQYALGGATGLQYGSTAHLAAPKATATVAGATIDADAASAVNMVAGACADVSFTAGTDKALYLSNDTAAFTTGDSDFVLHIWYRVVATA